jgi:hypothetical protein
VPLPLVIDGDQCDGSEKLPAKDIALLYSQLQAMLNRQHSRPNIPLEPRRSHPHSTPITTDDVLTTIEFRGFFNTCRYRQPLPIKSKNSSMTIFPTIIFLFPVTFPETPTFPPQPQCSSHGKVFPSPRAPIYVNPSISMFPNSHHSCHRAPSQTPMPCSLRDIHFLPIMTCYQGLSGSLPPATCSPRLSTLQQRASQPSLFSYDIL